MKLLRKSCLPGQLPASDRAEGTALSAGADAAQRPGRARREREDAAARGGTGMGSAETARRRCPARPGLPQGADEAVDRALRVQGHDVPYVEEAGHFIRHAASCSKVDVLPLRPRRPLPGAAAAEAERSARLQRQERRRRARPERPGVGLGSAARRESRPGATPQPQTPRDVRSPGTPRAAAAAAAAGFLFLSEVFLSNTFAPPPPTSSSSPPFSAPRRSRHRHREGASGCRAPWCPRGNFWTRWRCPLSEGEERSPGREANRGAAAGGGAGPGRGTRGRPGHPGSGGCGRSDPCANGTRGGAGGAPGARSRGGWAV